MAKLKMDYTSPLAKEKALQKLKKLLEQSQDLKNLDSDIELTFSEKEGLFTLKGRKIEAQLKVVPSEKGSLITVNVELPLILAPFKSKIQSSLLEQFKKHLG